MALSYNAALGFQSSNLMVSPLLCNSGILCFSVVGLSTCLGTQLVSHKTRLWVVDNESLSMFILRIHHRHPVTDNCTADGICVRVMSDIDLYMW